VLAATGSLTTDSPCTLPGSMAPDRCTVNLSISTFAAPVSCIWSLAPVQLYACQGIAAWTAGYDWATVTPRTLELRSHSDWPTNDPRFSSDINAVLSAGQLLAQVTVSAVSPNTPPVVSLSVSPTTGLVAPAAVGLSASASDSNGISKVEFFSGTTLLATDTSSPYAFSWTNVPAGTHSVTARAHDTLGATTTTAATVFSVAAPPGGTGTLTTNSPCSLPGPYANDRCTVSLSVSTSGAAISCVWATNPTQLTGCQGIPNWNGTNDWVTTTPRTLVLRSHSDWPTNDPRFNTDINAVYASGGFLAQATVVATSGNPAPMVSLSATPATGALSPATISLEASASDANGIARVEFFNGSTLLNTDTTAPYQFTWTNVAAGSYTLTARAHDTLGASASSSGVVVTVDASTPVNNVCIANTPATWRACAQQMNSGQTEAIRVVGTLNCSPSDPCEVVFSNLGTDGKLREIYGDGAASSVFTRTSAGGVHLMETAWSKNMVLRDFAVREIAPATSPSSSAVSVIWSSGILMDRLKLSDSGFTNVSIRDSNRVRLRNSTLKGGKTYGIWMGRFDEGQYRPYDIRIENNNISRATTNGLMVSGHDVAVTGNVFNDNHHTPLFGHMGGQIDVIRKSDNVRIEWNEMKRGYMVGNLASSGVELDSHQLNGISVRYNYIHDNDGYGIYINNYANASEVVTGIAFQNNRIVANGWDSIHYGPGQYPLVSNNCTTTSCLPSAPNGSIPNESYSCYADASVCYAAVTWSASGLASMEDTLTGAVFSTATSGTASIPVAKGQKRYVSLYSKGKLVDSAVVIGL
jgi:hypothetical protein